jgi:hypothetical protein
MKNNESQGYPERWVWAACAHIYNDPISDRTWRKYKQICQVPDFRKLKKGEEPIISKFQSSITLISNCHLAANHGNFR